MKHITGTGDATIGLPNCASQSNLINFILKKWNMWSNIRAVGLKILSLSFPFSLPLSHTRTVNTNNRPAEFSLHLSAGFDQLGRPPWLLNSWLSLGQGRGWVTRLGGGVIQRWGMGAAWCKRKPSTKIKTQSMSMFLCLNPPTHQPPRHCHHFVHPMNTLTVLTWSTDQRHFCYSASNKTPITKSTTLWRKLSIV